MLCFTKTNNKNVVLAAVSVIMWMGGVNGQNGNAVLNANINANFLRSDSNLANKNLPPGKLNTAKGKETKAQLEQRLLGEVPQGSIGALYSPLADAKCFNDVSYKPRDLTIDQMMDMYYDYKTIFDWGFENKMGSPLQGVSEDNNNVTNNRFPGMFLRMAFHDNTVDATKGSFRTYIKSKLKGRTFEWLGDPKNPVMETSGADASLLICPQERYHPNNNYDETASRVLYSLQSRKPFQSSAMVMSMKEKWKLSYADLLHNGAVAAAIYLTGAEPWPTFSYNPMQVGRRDACYTPLPGLRNGTLRKGPQQAKALCGGSELLPGLGFSVKEFNDWFKYRGMPECMWMALMWTHTTLDNMAFECPLMKLVATTTQEDYDFMTRKESTDKVYFNVGDELDYMDFLKQGKHKTVDDAENMGAKEQDLISCHWYPNSSGGVDGAEKNWPLTKADCTLGLQNVQNAGEARLASAIENFHDNDAARSLLCALRVIGGRGGIEGGACAGLKNDNCRVPNALGQGHLFGAFFG